MVLREFWYREETRNRLAILTLTAGSGVSAGTTNRSPVGVLLELLEEVSSCCGTSVGTSVVACGTVLDQQRRRPVSDEMLCDIWTLAASLKQQTAVASLWFAVVGVMSPLPLRQAAFLVGTRMSGAFH